MKNHTKLLAGATVILMAAFLGYLAGYKARDRAEGKPGSTIIMPGDRPAAVEITCTNNLKQLGLDFKTWAIDHDGQYPFNVSTNAGGTREQCAVDNAGFALNPALHFQALTNADQMPHPAILVCPKDHSKKPGSDFSNLKPENVTYRLHIGTNVSPAHPKEILAVCPVCGNTLHCDGTVTNKTAPSK